MRSSVRISVATGFGGGRQQRVDVGDQQHAAAIAHGGHRGGDALQPVLGAQRADFGTVEFDQPPLGAHRPYQRGLADPSGSGHQDAEIGCGAQGFEELGLVEREL